MIWAADKNGVSVREMDLSSAHLVSAPAKCGPLLASAVVDSHGWVRRTDLHAHAGRLRRLD